MSYKPDEQELMAYLYDELEGAEKERVEQYLLQNPEARLELEKLGGISKLLGTIKDKEVIAPPIFLGEPKHQWWNAPYFKTIVSIAASLIIVMLVARFSGTKVNIGDGEFRMSFGNDVARVKNPSSASALTPEQVQTMINQSLQANNNVLNTNWQESQVKLEKSIRENMVMNSDQMNALVRQASTASKDQVQQYIAGLQTENMKMVKDYFTLTQSEQKEYIEGLLVDFAKYLQQQQKNDIQLVESRISNLEQNTTVFKEETEQILTSIISSVGAPISTETKY